MSARPEDVKPPAEKEPAAAVWERAAIRRLKRTRGRVWGWRLVAGGLVLIAIAIAGVVIRVNGDEGDGAKTNADLNGEAAPAPSPAVVGPKAGIGFIRPEGWRKFRRKGAFVVQSPDKAVLISISDPAKAAKARGVRRDAIRAVRSTYQKTRAVPGRGRKIGGLKAQGAVIHARGPHGPLDILVAVARGRKLTYLVEVFTARSAPPETLRSAQLMLDSVRFTK